ncbi:MAG: sigma-54-dependent Fis family transcriptional regulator [Desulfofundulus sp.]|uniref:sigma-54-dependent Fis family transcriptional regulator n=1 Tax=Desulfofundulus sp. TaxID=2282750 RepID=UPI003C72AA75
MAFVTFNTQRQARDLFEKGNLHSAQLHPSLIGSWLRSRNYRVDSFIDAAPAVPTRPRNDLEKLLLKIAEPYFKYFGNLLLMCDCVLALSNSQGVLLYVETPNPGLKRLAVRHNFMVDALWSEEGVGTNAIGMALIEKTNVYLNGYEHYAYTWHPYCCAASPIFNPQTGDVAGVVDLTGFSDRVNLHAMGWVAAVARLIEAELARHILNNRNNRRKNCPSQNASHFYLCDGPVLKNLSRQVIGNDPVFLSALELAEKAARTELNVLLTGETGTGKEVFARMIHEKSSRAAGPFVAVNCGAVPKELMASELYGYLEGAFTGASRRGYPGRFEQADGGTLFLDEIGDAPLELQVGLLRVIEEGCVYRLGSVRPTSVNVRVLAATSKDLGAMIREGTFREDLYYRLSGITITVPPLRERREDIPLLAKYFLDVVRSKSGRCYVFEEELMQAFLTYHWPGNVRELKNTIERLAGLADDDLLTAGLFYQLIPKSVAAHPEQNAETAILVNAIRKAGGNLSRAAEILGINRTTLYRRIRKYGLKKEHIT